MQVSLFFDSQFATARAFDGRTPKIWTAGSIGSACGWASLHLPRSIYVFGRSNPRRTRQLQGEKLMHPRVYRDLIIRNFNLL